MKYVGFNAFICPEVAKRIIVVFPEDLTHSILAEHCSKSITQSLGGIRVEVVSAGFVSSDLQIEEGRRSESLGLGPDPDDQRALEGSDYGNHLIY